MTKRLAVIDGKSVFYRGYYAMPNLSLADGTPTGGVYGFTALSIELIKKLQPDYVAVAWDKRGTNIRKRQQIFPDYKAGRKPAPDDFYAQMPILFELLEAFGWPLYEIDDYEADDIMGAFALQAKQKGIETCLLTSDLDALQLVNDGVKVYALKNGLSNIEEFDIAYFENKYGIRVEQFLDFKALKGDSSDNLPGVPGIGEKTAISLLQEYDDLDNIYNNIDSIKPTIASKLIAGKDLAYMSKKVGQIWTDVPVQLDWGVADINDIDLEKITNILKRLEFFSLIKKLPKYMQVSQSEQKLDLPDLDSDLKIIKWSDKLAGDRPVFIYLEDEQVWLSDNQDTMMAQDLPNIDKSFWRQLVDRQLIAFDFKQIYHKLADYVDDIRFNNIYDIRQAEFLINPLKRDFSLSALVDSSLSRPQDYILALRQLFERQAEDFDNNQALAKVAEQLDFPLIHILFKMEKKGIKIDKQALSSMSRSLKSDYQKLTKEIYGLVGHEFNIASPSQLAEVLFSKLQLPTAGIKKGKIGYSTGQKELDKLRGQHPIIELIEKTRELAKLLNTYIDALPVLVDGNDRIHTTFNQDVVSTGRLSSTNPNLQNIPTKGSFGNLIRQAFIPETGNVFVGADYSQFELRLAAIMAGDKDMIDDFNNDIDIHSKTASDIYGVPVDEITKDQRRNAKVINFGVLYGMSPHGLASETGMSFIEAKKFIDQYFDLRQPIRRFITKTIEQARTVGYVETYFGRRRPTPDVLSSNFMVRTAAERAAANMPIQGTEADLMKKVMIKLDEVIGDLGEPILQVHDSILVECPKANAKEVAKILKTVMENVCPELKIKLKADVSIGDNWGEIG